MAYSTYALIYKTNILKTILFEVIQFFFYNKHYLGKDLQTQVIFFDGACSIIVEHFSRLLEILNINPLSEDEKSLSDFATSLTLGKKESVQNVKEFYLSQGFNFYAKAIALQSKKLSDFALFRPSPSQALVSVSFFSLFFRRFSSVSAAQAAPAAQASIINANQSVLRC